MSYPHGFGKETKIKEENNRGLLSIILYDQVEKPYSSLFSLKHTKLVCSFSYAHNFSIHSQTYMKIEEQERIILAHIMSCHGSFEYSF